METKELQQQQLDIAERKRLEELSLAFQQQPIDPVHSRVAQILQTQNSQLQQFTQRVPTPQSLQRPEPKLYNGFPAWMWLCFSGLGVGALLGTAAIISSAFTANNPHVLLTQQQEINAAVAMEAAKQRANYVCVLAWDCPNPEEKPTTVVGNSVQVAANLSPEQHEWYQRAMATDWESLNQFKANNMTPEWCAANPGACPAIDQAYQVQLASIRGNQ